jgi:hypothetical protein
VVSVLKIFIPIEFVSCWELSWNADEWGQSCTEDILAADVDIASYNIKKSWACNILLNSSWNLFYSQFIFNKLIFNNIFIDSVNLFCFLNKNYFEVNLSSFLYTL